MQTIGDQLTAKDLTWKAYKEDIANSPTLPKTCRHPVIGDRRRVDRADQDRHVRDAPRPVGVLPLASSTRRPATPKSSGLDVLPTDLDVGRDDAEPLLHHAERVRRRARRAVQGRSARWLGVRRRVLEDVGAEDPRVTRVQGRRDARDHVRRGRGRQGRRLDRVLQDAAVAELVRCPGSPVRVAGGSARWSSRPATKPNTTSPTPYNHYSLLCSMENVFGLDAPRLRRCARPRLLRQGRVQRAVARPRSG